jgi:macrolide phosphotransferase
MSEHVAGRAPDAQNPADMLAVVRGLADLHRWLQPIDPTLAVSQDDSLTLFARARALLADPQRPGFSPADILTLQQACELIDASLPAVHLWPRQLIHGDPSHPNLRLAPGPNGQLSGVLDWENCRVDFPLSDLSTVGQTVVFRSGSSDPLTDLATIQSVYNQQTEKHVDLGDLLLFMILGKFESIAHHGERFLRGEAQQELVLSQPTKIRAIVDLFRHAKGG